MKRNSKQYFSFDQVKNKFAHFGGLKNINKNCIYNFFRRLFFEVKGRYLHIFKKIFSFLSENLKIADYLKLGP